MSYKDYSLAKVFDSWHEESGINTRPPDINLDGNLMNALPFGGEYPNGKRIEVTDSKVTGSTTEISTTVTVYSATTRCCPKKDGWNSYCGGGDSNVIEINGTRMTGTKTASKVRTFNYTSGHTCHMSVAMYIGSDDTIGLTCEILVGNTMVFQIQNHSNWCKVTVKDKGNNNEIHPNKQEDGKGYSIVVKDMDISSVCKAGDNSITVGMAEASSSGEGGGDMFFLDIAVQTVGEEKTSSSSHTETETHTTTSTTTTSFPATSEVNLHAVKSGVEHVIPLYSDSDIQNSPGKDIENTFFWPGVRCGRVEYKQWMAANGASHPAVDPSHLYGYGHNVLGVYLKKGKDYEVVETDTYTTVVTVPGPG